MAAFAKAVTMGFYNGQRRRPGVSFPLKDPKDFKPSWMAQATAEEAAATPEAMNEAAKEHRMAMRGKGKKLQPNGVDPVKDDGKVDPAALLVEKATGDRNVLG